MASYKRYPLLHGLYVGARLYIQQGTHCWELKFTRNSNTRLESFSPPLASIGHIKDQIKKSARTKIKFISKLVLAMHRFAFRLSQIRADVDATSCHACRTFRNLRTMLEAQNRQNLAGWLCRAQSTHDYLPEVRRSYASVTASSGAFYLLSIDGRPCLNTPGTRVHYSNDTTPLKHFT